jgi:protein SCO1
MLLGLLLITVVPSIVLPTLVCRPAPPTLEDFGTVPAFSFVDHLGTPTTAEAFAGHVTIVNFVFTRCESVCPVSTMKMERIQEQTADLGERVKLLSFSVDPGYDTQARLAEYAKRYKAVPSRWRFLTGDPEAMRVLVEDTFKISMMVVGTTPSGAPDVAHNPHFVLVDKQQRIRGFYDSTDVPRLATMIRHARYLARQ